MRLRLFIFGMLLCLLYAPQTMAQNPPADAAPSQEFLKEDKALVDGEKAAKAWLKLVDAAYYAESWNHAAPYFKKAVSQKKWIKGVQALRAPLGKKQRRKLGTIKYAREIAGAPDGEYVIIRYISTFSRKKNALETLTIMRCQDGVWRVSGYYIR